MSETPQGDGPPRDPAAAAGAGAPAKNPGRFGTFGGVFTPCVLTILGVIMFMRSGFVVGDVGFWGALLILAMAKTITTLTTLSLSAIATNTEVRTGGVYFMISRTLGSDFGGAIGLTLFVSQAISVAFYVIGFSEALFGLLPQGSEIGATLASYRAEQLVSSGMIVVLFLVTFKGAGVAIKAQYFILAVLLLSVASFVVGGIGGFDSSTFADNQGSSESSGGFMIAFAIFFPAATGITAGANMSGDLKDPAQSIPRGTLLAIFFTAGIYLVQLVLLAGLENPDPSRFDSARDALVNDPFGSLTAMSVFGPLVVAGVFAATLSSALGSFLGAPRILQAMGQDRILSFLVPFGVGHGPDDEPRRATVLTLGIAVAIVWAGGLDAVARVISMFFLIAYGMINLSAFVEGRGGNPSFRPRFKLFGWPAALAGTIACAIAMVKIDETYAIVAMVIAGGVYFMLRGRTSGTWGDAKRGYIFARTRDNLLLLEKSTPDSKNWRPALAVVSDDCERDRQVITCASWLEATRGILSVLELSDDGGDARQRVALRRDRVALVREVLADQRVVAFPDAVVVPDPVSGMDTILQSYSIGSLRPNTLMLSVPPPGQSERRQKVAGMLRSIAAFDVNVIIYKGARSASAGRSRIDLWWHGQQNGSLMALFAYLVTTHPEWAKASVRILRVVQSGEEHLEAERDLRELMQAARMAMDVEVVLSHRPVAELIAGRSVDSDLVFLGMAQRDLTDFAAYLERSDPLLAQLPPTLLVRSTGEVDLLA